MRNGGKKYLEGNEGKEQEKKHFGSYFVVEIFPAANGTSIECNAVRRSRVPLTTHPFSWGGVTLGSFRFQVVLFDFMDREEDGIDMALVSNLNPLELYFYFLSIGRDFSSFRVGSVSSR